MTHHFIDDDDPERYRSRLKRRILISLATEPRNHNTLCGSTDEVLALIKSGEADMLLTWWSQTPAQHYAVRFTDRELGDDVREDCLDLYCLR